MRNTLDHYLDRISASTVGISAAAQLLPLLDYADLDRAELLAGDVASGVSVVNGVIQTPNRCGNGIELFELIAEIHERS